MDVQIQTNAEAATAATPAAAADAAPAVAETPAEPVLSGPGVTVLPEEIAQKHYESMKAIVDNFKPSERELELRERRLKEVRAKQLEAEIREKEDVAKAIERGRQAAANV